MKLSVIRTVTALLAALFASAASAADCLTVDAIVATNPTVPYAGGTYAVGNGRSFDIAVGVPPGVAGSDPVFLKKSCSPLSSSVYHTQNTYLAVELLGPQVTNVIVTFCDGAERNFVSARLLKVDYDGNAEKLTAQQFTAPAGGRAEVTYTATSGDAGELLFHGDPMSQFIFGGSETEIVQICVE